ncbi:TrmH family RNA methyltransferase [Treponema primitia]|nr:TrmH family RNA methyltransferase [Treponema primitia]
MIPLQKLERLPRSQGLRKIAKLFTEAEHRLSLGEAPAPDYIAYLQSLAALLTRDDSFSPAALQALNAAAICLQGELPEDIGSIRRALNTVRHIILAETGQQTADWDFIDHGGKLDPQRRRSFPGMVVYLEDIRSPFNVGAMFRTAESFGVEKIFLSPLCADPTHPRAKRTAMGCIDILPWERLDAEYAESPLFPPALSQAPLFALETGGTDIAHFCFPQKAVMIVGSEELGVSHEALAAADASLGRLSIPTYGAKGSLNASVAFGIALQAWAAALVLHEAT